MEISSIERELDDINRNYLQKQIPGATKLNRVESVEKLRNNTTNRVPTFTSKQGFSYQGQSNNDLDRLTHLKQESLETLQKMNLYPLAGGYSIPSTNSAVNIRSNEVNRIMQKYDNSDAALTHRRSQSISGPISQEGYQERGLRSSAITERMSSSKVKADKIYPPARESFGGKFDNPVRNDFQIPIEGDYETKRELQSEKRQQLTQLPERQDILHEFHIDSSYPKEVFKETQQQQAQSQSKPYSIGNQRKFEEIDQPNQLRAEEVPLRSARGRSYERQTYNPTPLRAFDLNFDQIPVRQNNFDLFRGPNQDRDSSINLSTTPQVFDNFGPKIRDEKRSGAYKNAMKALQDRIKALEEENISLKKKIAEEERSTEEMQKKFKDELSVLKEKEKELQEHFAKLQEHNNTLKQDLQDAKDIHLKFIEEQNALMHQFQKNQEEMQMAVDSTDGLKKQIQTLEDEKARHLEENLTDKTDLDNRIAELTEQLKITHNHAQKIEAEFKVTLQAKNEAEEQLDKLVSEASKTERRDCLIIAELESKFEKAQAQISQLEGQNILERERYEKELHSLRKKMSLFEERTRDIIKTYDQKIADVKNQRRGVLKTMKDSEKGVEELRNKIFKLERLNSRLDQRILRRDEIMRHFVELTDEIIERIKKENGLGALFKYVIQKRRAIDHDLIKTAEKPTKSRSKSKTKKKKVLKSRSGLSTQSKKKVKRFSVGEISKSNEDSRSSIPTLRRRSTAGKTISGLKKRSGSTNSLSNLIFDSRSSTPNRKSPERQTVLSFGGYSRSAEKKDRHAAITFAGNSGDDFSFLNRKTGSAGKNTRLDADPQLRVFDILKPRSQQTSLEDLGGYSRPERDVRVTPENRSPTQRLFENSSYGHLSPVYQSETSRTLGKPLFGNSFGSPDKLISPNVSADFARMTETEVSTEIVRLERAICELKREYQNVLNQSSRRDSNWKYEGDLRAKLSALSAELKGRTELLQNLKKHQANLFKSG